ncbi:hypothetical protein CgunFtcFv8_016629 [Champsocephalus gunnari]|uniref:Uncharacterized protein n=1 Tax=Champsocephalus gunnari TaxID=52237 RepID=A0AAN8HAL7_CHAGU|nr:hypothetical protein CgunFtcFv8_016629 [Champsocephalus gunnari]
MDASLPHTRGVRDSEARLCGCGLKISGTDSHQVCSSCLRLEHAHEAIDNTGSCGHCARFTIKSLRRRLARQASLSGQDPLMSVDLPAGNQDAGASTAEIEPRTVSVWGSSTAAAAEPESRAVSGWDPVAARDTGTEPHALPSWGSRLDLTMVSPAEDVLELDYMEDEEDASEFLLSDSDEQEDDIFMSSAQAATSPTSQTGKRRMCLTCPSFPRGFSAPLLPPCRGDASRKRRRTRPSTSASLEGSSHCLHSGSPSTKLPRTLLGSKYPNSRRRSPPRVPSPGRRRGRVGLENLRSRLQPRRSRPRISASSRGRRSERPDSPSFSPL